MGIGINLFKPDGDFDDEIKNIAGFVGEGVEDVSNKIIAQTLNNIWDLLENFDKHEICKQYKNLSMLIGKQVSVCRVERQDETATVCDVDENAGLSLNTRTGK